MPKTLYMIHTIANLVPMFNALADEILPGVRRQHIADEGLLRLVLNAGGLTPAAYRRVGDDVMTAEQAGADIVLLTCSSISPTVDVVQKMVSIPVLKIDVPMADKAVSLGRRVAVLATAPTTLTPTSELVRERAQTAGRDVQVDAVLAEGAYDHLMAGELEEHDAIILQYLRRLVNEADVVIVAQASMARALEKLPEAERKVPILTSPRMGVEQVREVLGTL